jgi:hypothetical protein
VKLTFVNTLKSRLEPQWNYHRGNEFGQFFLTAIPQRIGNRPFEQSKAPDTYDTYCLSGHPFGFEPENGQLQVLTKHYAPFVAYSPLLDQRRILSH